MSVRAHRVIKIVYAEGETFNASSKLAHCIRDHEDTNDQTNHDGGGMIETTLRALKEILEDSKKLKIPKEEILILKNEISTLEKEGKDDDDFITYDMY